MKPSYLKSLFVLLANYSSTNIPSQLGSFMVTDVVSEGTSDGFALYKVTGNFECLVKSNESVMAANLTEGKFVLRFAVE